MKNKEVKVALMGNMNNNFFVLQRYLIDEGIDCHLFVLPDEPEHFLPENDSWNENVSNLYTRLNWGRVTEFSSVSIDEIRNELAGYSNFIACGASIAFLEKAGIDIDIIIPYGSDLYSLPFSYPKNPLKWINKYQFNQSIISGIKKSRSISLADNSEKLLTPLRRFDFKGKVIHSGVPMVYTENGSIKKSKYFKEFSSIREGNDLIIFHHSRHVWKTTSDPIAVKRNDKLIKAISKCVKETNTKIALITLEYGVDVDESKKIDI